MLANGDESLLKYVNGAALVEPLTAFADPGEAQRPVAMFRMASYFLQTAGHPSYMPVRPPPHKAHWADDPLAP